MKSTALTAVALIGVAGSFGPALAQSESIDAVLRRLEAKVEALSTQNATLSKQNAALNERVRKMESRPAAAKPATTAEQAPDLNLSQAARTANAAYMPVKSGPAYRAPCASFQGWYVGAQGGAATHNWTWNDRNAWARNEVDLALPSDVNGSKTGWHAGVDGGYNWQSGCTLFGIETDWNWAGLDQSKRNTDGQPGAALDTLVVTSDVRWFGSLRGRSGVVVDNLLIYLTGGLVYADIKYDAALTNNIGGVFVTETLSSRDRRWGWTAGIGTEWAWTNTASLKAEVLYAQFRDEDKTFNSPFATLNGNPPSKGFDFQDSVWIGRVGVNFKLGDWGKAPVSAKY